MKTLKLIQLFAMLPFITLTSCVKDDNMHQTLNDDEVVALITLSLENSTSGLNSEIEKSASDTTENYAENLTCNETILDNFEWNYQDENVNADYNAQWQYTLNCTAINIPTSIVLDTNSSGFYNTNHLSSVDNSESTLTIIGIEPSSTILTFSGNYKREGTQEISYAQNRTISSAIKMQFDSITVDKETSQIVSGTATISVTGNITLSDNFAFDGEIVFTGNRTAQLTLNGVTYNINLN